MYNVSNEVTELRRLFSEHFERAIRVLTAVVRGRLEHVEGADETINKSFLFQPDENLKHSSLPLVKSNPYLLLVFSFESVRVPHENGDGIFHPVGHDSILVLAVTEGIFTLRSEFVDPD